jgi:molybdopterin-containing oxidoreductase family iron-sulfur binding subunit
VSAFVQAAAKDLVAHRGKGIIIVGEQQPAEMHALAHVLNAALGNVGQSVWYSEDPAGGRPGHVQAIRQLVEAMQAKQVETLLMLGGNPIYNGPADLDFAGAMAAVPVRIQLSLYWNETSRLCTWHLPRAHYLETWGDTRAYDGTYAPAQPLISPLYEGRSVIELLSQLCETPALSGYEIVQRTVRPLLGRSAGGHAPATAQEHGTRPSVGGMAANNAAMAPAGALAGKLPVALIARSTVAHDAAMAPKGRTACPCSACSCNGAGAWHPRPSNTIIARIGRPLAYDFGRLEGR